MKLRISHFPQIPCKPFITEVDDLKQAKFLCDSLANYDLFQFENRIKPDYSNITVGEMWDEDEQEWCSWFDDEQLRLLSECSGGTCEWDFEK